MEILKIFGTALGCGITMAFGFLIGALAVRCTLPKGTERKQWQEMMDFHKETLSALREANELRNHLKFSIWDMRGTLERMVTPLQNLSRSSNQLLSSFKDGVSAAKELKEVISEPLDELKIGTKVEWTSQSGGFTKTKQGIVARIIPPNTSFRLGDEIKTRRMFDGACRPRPETSYIVNVGGKLYWPRTKNLKVISDDIKAQPE